MSVEGSDAGAPKSDVFDRAVVFVDHDPFTDLKRFVEQDRNGPEKIGDGILCGEGNGPEWQFRRGGGLEI